MEVNKGGSTVLPDCMSSVMPRWFSVISPMRSGNIGNVPLVMIAALCRDKSNPFGDTEKCSQDGNAYISFGQWGSMGWCTYVFHMLAPPPGGYDAGDEDLTLKSPTRDHRFFEYHYEKLKLKQIIQPPIIASELVEKLKVPSVAQLMKIAINDLNKCLHHWRIVILHFRSS